MQVAETSVSYG